MLRRKSIPDHLQPAWDHFSLQAARVEQARQALLGCLPVGRVDPAPVPVGLDLLRDELTVVGADIDVWRVPEIEPHWRACQASLAEAAAAIEPARRVAATTVELEELLAAVGEVVEPLDAWRAAERHWRSLRVRS